MKIWIDADACPGVVKEIVLRAAIKRSVRVVFVSNKQISLPESDLVSFELVAQGADKADHFIVENVSPGDLVITQDVPLAHRLVSTGITVLDQRGGQFTEDNIAERLCVRDIMQDIRDTGQQTGGPKPFGEKEKREFASVFDRTLTRLLNRK